MYCATTKRCLVRLHHSDILDKLVVKKSVCRMQDPLCDWRLIGDAKLCCRYVRQKERELHQCEAALEEHKDRIKVMQEHLRNVQVGSINARLRIKVSFASFGRFFRSSSACSLRRWPQPRNSPLIILWTCI
jgi:hypothetical protein